MARRSPGERENDEVELNMTPMLDVVFILLIFFIVVSVFVKEPGIDVTRPQVNNLNKVRPTILVAVSANDEIWINKRLVPPEELRPALIALRQENPRADAIIQGDETARFEVVYEVMQTLQEIGIPHQFVSVDPN